MYIFKKKEYESDVCHNASNFTIFTKIISATLALTLIFNCTVPVKSYAEENLEEGKEVYIDGICYHGVAV